MALGILGNVVAVTLLGGKVADAFAPSWLLAGALAGLAAGRHTIWSRQRRDGSETFVDGLATYYLGILVYWLGIVVLERARLCARHGGWTDFDLHDQLTSIFTLLLVGTFWWGILLIPCCFLSRYALWKLYTRTARF